MTARRVAVAATVGILTKSSVTDLVTEMDHVGGGVLVGSILAARPDDAIEGEEGRAGPGTSGVRWYVDPIDGTVNYVHGLPGFSVSVAAESAGEIVAGETTTPATTCPAISAAIDTQKPGIPWT